MQPPQGLLLICGQTASLEWCSDLTSHDGTAAHEGNFGTNSGFSDIAKLMLLTTRQAPKTFRVMVVFASAARGPGSVLSGALGSCPCRPSAQSSKICLGWSVIGAARMFNRLDRHRSRAGP